MKVLLLITFIISSSIPTKQSNDCFEKYIGIKETKDVTILGCRVFDDCEWAYQMAFKCDKKTWLKIIKERELEPFDNVYYHDSWKEYEWWQHETLLKFEHQFFRKVKAGIHSYTSKFWYDESEGIVYSALGFSHRCL